MSHTLFLFNRAEDALLAYGRHVTKIEADRAALLEVCKALLADDDYQRRQAARAAIAEAEKPIGESKCD
jgi:hypothetical protein